jgi:hypothetical protein
MFCYEQRKIGILLWRVTGTFFQKTITAGQIISALLIRLPISFTEQF